MAYWKAAGISYLQYVNLATTALRQAVKPALVSKYAIKEDVHFKKQVWTNGKPGDKGQIINQTRRINSSGKTIYWTGSLQKPVLGYENSTGHLSPDAVLAKPAAK